MNRIELENVLALNDELTALAEVGIPSNLADGAAHLALSGALKQINSSLTLRTQLGQTLLAATAGNQELPPIYRSALEAGLRSNRLSATLDGISRQATADEELRSTLGQSLIAPLIVAILAYLGFVMLCLNFLPTVESMYAQVGQTPGQATRILVAIGNAMPYWAALFPLLLLGAVVFWRRGGGNWPRLVPGARRYTAAVRNANFAHQLRLLVDNGLPLAESLPVAAAVTGDARLMTACFAMSQGAVAAPTAKGETPAVDAAGLSALPPLLRWALSGDLGDQSLSEILKFAEKTYRHKAERCAATWRLALPATIGALLGGCLVLAYGWSLFGPYVQLLEALAF